MFYFFAAPGLLLAIFWYFLSDEPRKSRVTNAAELECIETGAAPDAAQKQFVRRPLLEKIVRARIVEPLASNLEVLRSPSLRGCSLAYGLMSGLSYSILTWVPTYLVDVKKYSLMQMGFVASAPWVGAVAGSVVGGLLSDRLFDERRKPVMMVTTGSPIFTMYALILAPNDPVAFGALPLLGLALPWEAKVLGVLPTGKAHGALGVFPAKAA